jgi:sulfur carrier protein ThiS
MVTTKLTDLLAELNFNIELLAVKGSSNPAETMNG